MTPFGSAQDDALKENDQLPNSKFQINSKIQNPNVQNTEEVERDSELAEENITTVSFSPNPLIIESFNHDEIRLLELTIELTTDSTT